MVRVNLAAEAIIIACKAGGAWLQKLKMSLESSLESPWSQLVSIGSGSEEEVIPIAGDTLSIGRKRGEALDGPDHTH